MTSRYTTHYPGFMGANTKNLLFLLLTLLVTFPLAAQTTPPPDPDSGTVEEPLPDDDHKPFDPTQPISSWNDPGTDGVGALTDEDLLALFSEIPVTPLDPQYLEDTVLPDGAPEPADTPFAIGDRCATSTFPIPVKPLKVYAPNPRYLVFPGGPPLVLVGASADAGCAHKATTANTNVCNYGNYAAQFLEAQQLGLNKVQVWVALLSDLAPENQPFKYVPVSQTNPVAYWQLDVPNQAYFVKLFNVVAEAKRLGLFVEVVFLIAGGELDHTQSRFRQGPWGGAGQVAGRPVKFDQREDFLKASATFKPELFAAQKAVIQWTIDELWCVDRLFYQIANEPEGKVGLTSALSVAWHRAMVAQVLAVEQKYKNDGRLAGGHLIGVQPFLAATAASLSQDANIAILNGHYTTAFQALPAAIDLGALQLVRTNPMTPKIFGFNEGKITTLGKGGAATEMHLYPTATVAQWGTPEAARAEAWEFFFHQGAHFDHFGYRPVSSTGAVDSRALAIRTQLGKLRAFLQGLPLARLKPSANPPAWVNLPPYPVERTGFENWEPSTLSRKYPAALETLNASTATTGRVYLAFVHHSVPRCYSPDRDFLGLQAKCGPPIGSDPTLLVFQGYDARIKADGYQETVTLQLGSAPGTFRAEWIHPATGLATLSTTISWRPANGGECTNPNGVVLRPCKLTSPKYNYDVILKLTQQ